VAHNLAVMVALADGADAMPADLVSAIRAVAAGDAVVAPGVTRRLIERFAHHIPSVGGRSPVDERLAGLTARERDVLLELACATAPRSWSSPTRTVSSTQEDERGA
jgi:DNA-binding NarL/FixJ family response regulator